MKLHLGCGKRYLSGYFHVDIEPYDHVDLVSSIKDLSKIDSNSVSQIYSSHAFEYFSRHEAPDVLREWYRVLKKGGELRLSVPSFESLTKVYLQYGDLSQILGPLFGEWNNTSTGVLFHKMVWDFKLLSRYLIDAGYSQIEEFNPIAFLGGIDPDYDDFSLAYVPHFDRSGQQISLCIKAEKL
jgi:predicted SAM-dependent methyltransferase